MRKLFGALILTLMSGVASAALPTLDDSTNGAGTTDPIFRDVTLSSGSGNDRFCALATFSEFDSLQAAPELDGTAGTLAAQSEGLPNAAYIYYWLDADMPASSGTYSFEVNMDGTNHRTLHGRCYEGVDQNGAFTTETGRDDTGSAQDLTSDSFTSTDDSIVFSVFGFNIGQTTVTFGTDQTEAYSNTSAGQESYYTVKEVTSGSSSETVSVDGDTNSRIVNVNLVIPSASSDSDPPSITSGPTLTFKDEDSATFSVTATDATGPIDHYGAAYTSGSNPSAANVKAGNGTGFVTGTADSDLNVTSGNAATLETGNNLTAGTAYEFCVVQEDDNGNLSSSPTCADFVPLNITAHLITDDWSETEDAASHTPDRDYQSVGNWTEGKLYTGADAPDGDVDGELTISTANGTVERDVFTSDVLVTTDITLDADDWCSIMVRKTTDGNALYVTLRSDQDLVQMGRVNSDSFAGVLTSDAHTFSAGNTYTLQVAAVGNDIFAFVDGEYKFTWTDTFNNTATKVGLVANRAGCVFDDTYVMLARSGVDSNINAKRDDPQGILSEKSGVEDGDWFALDPADLPDRSYNELSIYAGGTFKYTPETSYVGDDVMDFLFFDSSAQTLSSPFSAGNLTITTESTSPPAAPSWNEDPPDFEWTLNVDPGNYNLCQHLDPGTPASEHSITVSTGELPSGRVLSGDNNCTLSGTPNADDGTSPLQFTSTNTTGSDTTGNVTFTVSSQSGEAPVLLDEFKDRVDFVGDSVSIDLGIKFSGETSCSASGLPNWLARSGSVLTGDVDETGTSEIIVTCSNTAGSAQDTFELRTYSALPTECENVTLHDWLVDATGTTGQINQLWLDLLTSHGYTEGSLNYRLKKWFYEALDYEGAFSDQFYQFQQNHYSLSCETEE